MLKRLGREGPLASEVWSLAWPAISHMFLVTLMLLAGRAMVGRYSSAALASLQISGTLTWSAYSVFTAFSVGTLSVVARSTGAGDRAGAARATRASLILALVLGLAVTVPLRVANGALLHAVFPRADGAIIADASAYLHIVLPILPLAFVEAVSAAALQGTGDTRTPLVVAIAGNAVNVVLSWILIFGHCGAPRLGIRGAAIGNAATLSIEGLLLAGALLLRSSPLPVRDTPILRNAELTALRRVLRIAWPAFGDRAAYHVGFLGFVAIIGLLGATVMAANQALVAIEAVCFLSADGFGIAAGALTAQKLGAGKPSEAARVNAIATAMAMALLSSIGLVFVAFPAPLVGAFSSDPTIVSAGSKALLVTAIAQPFMAFATVTAMSLRGAGDTRTVLGVTITSTLIIRLVATYLFVIVLDLGLVGVWMGSTADWVCRTAMLGAAFARRPWRRLSV